MWPRYPPPPVRVNLLFHYLPPLPLGAYVLNGCPLTEVAKMLQYTGKMDDLSNRSVFMKRYEISQSSGQTNSRSAKRSADL